MAQESSEAIQKTLREIQGTLGEHGRLLQSLSTRVDELRDGMIMALGLAKSADLRHGAVQRDIEELKRWADLVDEIEEEIPGPSESDIRLNELMAELEKLPPEELKRQMEAAAAMLLEEQSCQTPR